MKDILIRLFSKLLYVLLESLKVIIKFGINHKVIFDYLFKSSYMPV